ncbi:helix-turn-helix transcriptional regulator [Sphingomonas sp. Root710]|uniref:helix-turn-helix transcriptional regulator n=1 Tax=Sphingomonas sp. Root710 TaxID=1736594 RepID=UPI0009E92EAB|nr:helix-turn-helix domain-containing protein [Sphingomonas sp. Root710]
MIDSVTTPRFLSNEQAAKYLNLSPRTLEKLRVVGGGPLYRKLGRRVIYAFSDLNAWADARACASTTEAAHKLRR